MVESPYDVITTQYGETIIKRVADGACIPNDEGNADYKKYLEWKNQQGGDKS